MEHRDPEAGQDQQAEHGGVGMDDPSQSGADPGEDQAKRRHPEQRTTIGNEPDHELGTALPTVAARARPEAAA
jgi:hypothetical protein